MHQRALGGIFAVLVLVGVLLFPGIAAAAPLAGKSDAGINATITNYVSGNWAGYVASGSSGSTTKVAGAWVQPTATCTSGSSYAVFWVGIDGAFSPSSTVEQVGTLLHCSGSTVTQYAWWELFPLNAIQKITTITVHSGDHITASVTYSGGTYTMSIKDGTHSFSKTGTQSGTVRNSAECIAERPSVGGTPTHLTKFGTVTFSSCTGTISGHSGGIGTFSSVGKITMESLLTGHAVLASPGALNSTKTSFSVTWKKAN
jgi:Peptidase A4 family